jgi:hypothetical protein
MLLLLLQLSFQTVADSSYTSADKTVKNKCTHNQNTHITIHGQQNVKFTKQVKTTTAQDTHQMK